MLANPYMFLQIFFFQMYFNLLKYVLTMPWQYMCCLLMKRWNMMWIWIKVTLDNYEVLALDHKLGEKRNVINMVLLKEHEWINWDINHCMKNNSFCHGKSCPWLIFWSNRLPHHTLCFLQQKHLADRFLWLLKSFFKESFYSTEQGEEGTRSARKDYNPWLHHSFEPLLDNKSEEQGYVLKTVIQQTKKTLNLPLSFHLINLIIAAFLMVKLSHGCQLWLFDLIWD